MNNPSKPNELHSRKALTPEQTEAFWRDGYLSIGKILDDQEIDLYRLEYDRELERARVGNTESKNLATEDLIKVHTDTETIHTEDPADPQLLQLTQMCERNIHFRRLLYHPRFLDLVEDLIGPNIQLSHDQAIFKPPHHGVPVHWHQDNAYWNCSPPNLISLWLTLDDVDADNGAMQLIPGSHFRAISHQSAVDTRGQHGLKEKVDPSKAVVVDLPAGGVTLHHCQTLHYTAPNITDRQRRAFVIHYMMIGTRQLKGSLREADGHFLASFQNPVLRLRM